MIIQISQLTAGDKLIVGLDTKISTTTINHHLKPENTVITRELARVKEQFVRTSPICKIRFY